MAQQAIVVGFIQVASNHVEGVRARSSITWIKSEEALYRIIAQAFTCLFRDSIGQCLIHLGRVDGLLDAFHKLAYDGFW